MEMNTKPRRLHLPRPLRTAQNKGGGEQTDGGSNQPPQDLLRRAAGVGGAVGGVIGGLDRRVDRLLLLPATPALIG